MCPGASERRAVRPGGDPPKTPTASPFVTNSPATARTPRVDSWATARSGDCFTGLLVLGSDGLSDGLSDGAPPTAWGGAGLLDRVGRRVGAEVAELADPLGSRPRGKEPEQPRPHLHGAA